MARRSVALLASIACIALAGCASSTPSPSSSALPSQRATVEGSTATLAYGGDAWSLELLELGLAPEDAIVARDGSVAPPPPDGFEIAWACFRVTVVAAADGYAIVEEVLRDVTLPGEEHAHGYAVDDAEIDLSGTGGEAGDEIPRRCEPLLVPEGSAYDAVTLVSRSAGDDVTVQVPAP